MRIRILLSSDAPILLPPGYNSSVQACLYGLLDEDFNRYLHNDGFVLGKRKFKLFTFSRIFGHFVKRNGAMRFGRRISLLVSSPISEFVQQVVSRLTETRIRIGPNSLRVEEIDFLETPKLETPITVRTLSPITVYSTLRDGEGRKETRYYTPYEDEFSALIRSNLLKKAQLMGICAGEDFEIEPIKEDHKVVMFKDTPVSAWVGKFRVSGDKNLLYAGYEAGFGNKNSAGFGMVEVV